MSNSSFSNSNETDSKHSSNTDQPNPFSSSSFDNSSSSSSSSPSSPTHYSPSHVSLSSSSASKSSKWSSLPGVSVVSNPLPKYKDCRVTLKTTLSTLKQNNIIFHLETKQFYKIKSISTPGNNKSPILSIKRLHLNPNNTNEQQQTNPSTNYDKISLENNDEFATSINVNIYYINYNNHSLHFQFPFQINDSYKTFINDICKVYHGNTSNFELVYKNKHISNLNIKPFTKISSLQSFDIINDYFVLIENKSSHSNSISLFKHWNTFYFNKSTQIHLVFNSSQKFLHLKTLSLPETITELFLSVYKISNVYNKTISVNQSKYIMDSNWKSSASFSSTIKQYKYIKLKSSSPRSNNFNIENNNIVLEPFSVYIFTLDIPDGNHLIYECKNFIEINPLMIISQLGKIIISEIAYTEISELIYRLNINK